LKIEGRLLWIETPHHAFGRGLELSRIEARTDEHVLILRTMLREDDGHADIEVRRAAQFRLHAREMTAAQAPQKAHRLDVQDVAMKEVLAETEPQVPGDGSDDDGQGTGVDMLLPAGWEAIADEGQQRGELDACC
jgi:hypothetical protein